MLVFICLTPAGPLQVYSAVYPVPNLTLSKLIKRQDKDSHLPKVFFFIYIKNKIGWGCRPNLEVNYRFCLFRSCSVMDGVILIFPQK